MNCSQMSDDVEELQSKRQKISHENMSSANRSIASRHQLVPNRYISNDAKKELNEIISEIKTANKYNTSII